jgi:hypothetical protein
MPSSPHIISKKNVVSLVVKYRPTDAYDFDFSASWQIPTMSIVKFYDLLSAHPKIWWSPNTYKTRFLLNYKEIPYTVIPTHYPDIRDVSLKLNLAEDRYPKWPLPIIEHDGNVIRGSLDIAKYLDSAFPERRLMGRNARSGNSTSVRMCCSPYGP